MPDVPAIQYDAFISYAWRDEHKGATALDTALQTKEFRVWRDKRDIDPTQDFRVEIERAIESADCLIVCVTEHVTKPDSYVQREIAYAETLRKPIFVARFEDVLPPERVQWLTRLDFFNDWQGNFNRLCEWLIKKRTPDSGRNVPPSIDPFRPYVEALYKQIVADLKFSVFSDDVIPLRSQSAPDAVPTPTLTTRFVTYSVAEPKSQPEATRDFDSFPAAYQHYDGRVLLLGEPGAGKTTTLLSFARDAAAARLNDPTQPLPILARIAGWDSLNETPLSEWLSTEIESLVGTPFMASAAPIANQITQGNTLLLLDGLDELGAGRLLDPNNPQEGTYDPRARFLPLIPAIGRVLLTSREEEYSQIGLKAGLKGAVVLKPLDDAQMQAYLTGMDDLWAVLASDNALREAIRTPLLLALFRVAFAELPEEARQLRDLSGGELNDRIWSLFIERRWKHEQARSSEPLTITTQAIREVLGIAAVMMMEMGFRNGTLFTLLDVTEFWDEEDSVSKLNDIIQFAQHLRLVQSVGEVILSEVTGSKKDDYYSIEAYRFLHLRLRDYFAFTGSCIYFNHEAFLLKSRIADALRKSNDPRALGILNTLLNDDDEYVRLCAVEAVGELKSGDTFTTLVKCLDDLDETVQIAAIKSLAKTRDSRANKVLRELASDSEDTSHYMLVSQALGELGDLEHLIKCLENYAFLEDDETIWFDNMY